MSNLKMIRNEAKLERMDHNSEQAGTKDRKHLISLSRHRVISFAVSLSV